MTLTLLLTGTLLFGVHGQDEADIGCSCVRTAVSNALVIPPLCAVRWHRPTAWCYVEPSLHCPQVYVDSVVEGSFWAYCEDNTDAPTVSPTLAEVTASPSMSPATHCGGTRDICNNNGFYIQSFVDDGNDCYCACDQGWTGRHCDREVVWQCPEGRIEIGGAMITTPQMENNQLVTLLCPEGYLGNVQFLCTGTTVSLFYGTCVMNLWSSSSTQAVIETRVPSATPSTLPSIIPTSPINTEPVTETETEKSADSEKQIPTSNEEITQDSMRDHFLYAAILAAILMLVLCCFLTWCCLYRLNTNHEKSLGLEYMTRNVNHMPEVRHDSDDDSVGGNVLTVSYVAPEDVAPEDNQRELPKESTEVSSTFSTMPIMLEMPSSPNHLLSSRSTSISRPPYQSVSCTPLKRRGKKSIFSDTSSMFSTTGTDSSTNRSRSRQRERDVAMSYPPISSLKFCRSRPDTFNLEANDSHIENRHVLLSPIKESESFSNQSKLAENGGGGGAPAPARHDEHAPDHQNCDRGGKEAGL